MSNLRHIKNSLDGLVSQQQEKSVLALYHVNINGYKQPIGRLNDWPSSEEATTWALESARQYANGMGSTQRFLISAFAPDDLERTQPLITVAFKAAAEASEANDGDNLLSEPPSQVGLLAQLMRHNQEMHKQNAGMVGALTMHMARTIEAQASQIERLTTDRSTAMTTMEELMGKKHEREMEMKKTEAKIVMQRETYDKVAQLLPVIVNKIAGKELIHQKDSALEAVTTEFLSSLTPSKLDALAQTGVLDRNQLLLVTTMLEQVSKRMVTTDEKKELMAQSDVAKTNGLR